MTDGDEYWTVWWPWDVFPWVLISLGFLASSYLIGEALLALVIGLHTPYAFSPVGNTVCGFVITAPWLYFVVFKARAEEREREEASYAARPTEEEE